MKDLIVTPVWLILIITGAYLIRPYVTTVDNRKYFFKAFFLRLFGALFIGFLYQFYYSGGDTFFYHTKGSAVIFEALTENLGHGLRLLFYDGDYQGLKYSYMSRIPYLDDPGSFMIVRIATLLDLLTFSTYSSTALLFGCISFSGAWLMFVSYEKYFPDYRNGLALAILFVPSVIIWGSGLLKDTVTLAALGTSVYAIENLFITGNKRTISILLLVVSLYLIFVIKIYILLCLLPAAILFIVLYKFENIRHPVLKIILYPVVLSLIAGSSYLLLDTITSNNEKYSLSNLATTAQITAYDIAYWTGRNAGSTYDIGELDGTFQSILRLMPAAVNVSLFRPYIWEVNNLLMMFSAGEALVIFLFTIYVLYQSRIILLPKIFSAHVLFCLLFALIFAFAVGASTFNFGTLSRYKIPLVPFYLTGLLMLLQNKLTLQKQIHTDL